MADVGLQESYLLERVVDPSTPEFNELMAKLLKPRTDDRTRQEKLAGKGEFRYTFPCRGDVDNERELMEMTPFVFSDRATYRNGVDSLALSMADMVDMIVIASNRTRMTPTLVITAEADLLQQTLGSGGSVSTLVHYCTYDNVADALVAVRPETVVFDHTTVNCPLDKLLNLAYRAGVQVVDGVFPYHIAGVRGWDVVTGVGKWSYTHAAGNLVVGPDDDASRMIKYRHADYKKFTLPDLWAGKSREYSYELRKCKHGLATYRAVYVGDSGMQNHHIESFKLPLCSSEDMVLVSINRALAAGVFVSKSNNAQDMAKLHKDYCIEVRRDLFVSCVDYLIAKDKHADIVGESVRYINQHNYVDLVDGVRIVRCASSAYADALCVSMVCALTSFMLRYRLTNESMPVIQRSVSAAKLANRAPFGALGRLAWLLGTYVGDAVSNVAARARDAAVQKLYSTDYIPGVCFDVYMDVFYVPDAPWYQPGEYSLQQPPSQVDIVDDPFTNYIANNEKTATPNIIREKPVDSAGDRVIDVEYKHNVVPDPEVVLQHVYDQAFPGNSTMQLQNVAELRRVRPVNINTEFYGRIEVAKDIAAPERLHHDAPVRTSALPVSRTPLVDAIMASAKRNFNPPDLQLQNDPMEYAKSLVGRFIANMFVPNYVDTLGKSYKRDLLTFNVVDYVEWRATRDKAYRSALEGECPEWLVELSMDRFDTMVKQRIKPKMSTSAQHELSQPQVIVSMSKRDTALFTSLFRQVFVRFENALRPEYKSAGRSSDADVSQWLSEHRASLLALSAIELDSTKYDKSQNMLARLIEVVLFEELGLDPQVMEIYSDSYVGKVSSRSLGIAFTIAYQMKSGLPDTMLGNIVYNAVSAGESVGWRNILLMLMKGDDNVLWLSGSVAQDLVVSKMSGLFNLEVKLISSSVLYFSSGYIIPAGSGVHFVPDPLKVLELMGEIGADPLQEDERYVSFCDRVASYRAHHALPALLQEAVRRRLAVPELDVVMAVDALLSMAASRGVYNRVIPVVKKV